MPKLSTDVVRHVAGLAKLELTEAELSAYREQLERVLAYMAELDAVAVDGVPPTFRSVSPAPRLRDDVPGPCLGHDEALANAPRAVAGGFAVPRVLEDE